MTTDELIKIAIAAFVTNYQTDGIDPAREDATRIAIGTFYLASRFEQHTILYDIMQNYVDRAITLYFEQQAHDLMMDSTVSPA